MIYIHNEKPRITAYYTERMTRVCAITLKLYVQQQSLIVYRFSAVIDKETDLK